MSFALGKKGKPTTIFLVFIRRTKKTKAYIEAQRLIFLIKYSSGSEISLIEDKRKCIIWLLIIWKEDTIKNIRKR